MKKTTKVILCLLMFLILISTCIYAYETLYKKQTPIDNENKYNISDNINYTVILKPNGNSNETYIYLDSGYGYGEIPFITIDNVYKEHYHNNEFVNGNLYIIKRIIHSEKTDWTDELWKYDKDGKGTKIFSARGIDFRTFNNGKNIAIINGPILKIINNEGLFLKEFYSKDLSIDPENKNMSTIFLTSNFIKDNYIVLVNSKATSILGLTKIDTISDKITKYDFRDLGVDMSEFDISPSLDKIVFSTYRYLSNTNPEETFIETGIKTYLIVYNLETKEKNIILSRTSLDGRFLPVWIDDNKIEYEIPATETQDGTRIQTNI